jgi:nitrate reductase NapE
MMVRTEQGNANMPKIVAPLHADGKPSRTKELITFAVLAFGIWPVLAVGFVGAYGFIVWMFQIIYGPPGPPGH